MGKNHASQYANFGSLHELELKPEERKLPSEILLHEEAISAFKAWMNKEDKIEY